MNWPWDSTACVKAIQLGLQLMPSAALRVVDNEVGVHNSVVMSGSPAVAAMMEGKVLEMLRGIPHLTHDPGAFALHDISWIA